MSFPVSGVITLTLCGKSLLSQLTATPDGTHWFAQPGDQSGVPPAHSGGIAAANIYNFAAPTSAPSFSSGTSAYFNAEINVIDFSGHGTIYDWDGSAPLGVTPPYSGQFVYYDMYTATGGIAGVVDGGAYTDHNRFFCSGTAAVGAVTRRPQTVSPPSAQPTSYAFGSSAVDLTWPIRVNINNGVSGIAGVAVEFGVNLSGAKFAVLTGTTDASGNLTGNVDYYLGTSGGINFGTGITDPGAFKSGIYYVKMTFPNGQTLASSGISISSFTQSLYSSSPTMTSVEVVGIAYVVADGVSSLGTSPASSYFFRVAGYTGAPISIPLKGTANTGQDKGIYHSARADHGAGSPTAGQILYSRADAPAPYGGVFDLTDVSVATPPSGKKDTEPRLVTLPDGTVRCLFTRQ